MTNLSVFFQNLFQNPRIPVTISVCSLMLVTCVASPRTVLSQTIETAPDVASGAVQPARRWALIIVGLPGDEEHRERFNSMVKTWQQWLTEIAGVEKKNVIVLGGGGKDSRPAMAESIRTQVASVKTSLLPDDSLWVFLLGHGSEDDRHGWFHLPGPDLNGAQWAGLFARVEVKEEVFWLTQSASGSFVKPFSRPGRVIISATDVGEVNEPRFPRALTEIMRGQLKSVSPSETTEWMPSTVLELFRETVRHVDNSFDNDMSVPTEHALLDDNGDGVGTDEADLAVSVDGESRADSAAIDGVISGEMKLFNKTN